MKGLIIPIIILCFSCSSVLFAQQYRVWVDTDIASGKLHGDMDDAITLLMLLRDTSIAIEGISLVQDVKHAHTTTQKLISWYGNGRQIPLYKGATSFKNFGQPNAATAALIAALEQGPIIILALGPATNVTTALQLRPDLQQNVQALSFCAGRRPGMLFSPANKARFSDYNFDLDSTAGRLLVGMNIPITLAGYDCSDSLFITKAEYGFLKQSNKPGDRWIYRNMKRWEGFWRTFIGTTKGFIPFDCSTYGVLFYPNEFDVELYIPAYVAVAENDTQHTIKGPTKAYLLVNRAANTKTVDYCHYTKPAFKQRLLKALGKTSSD